MNILLLATIFLEGSGTEPVGVPALVPIAIGVILLLLFIWGVNRDNIPQGQAAHADDHHEPQLHAEPHTEDAHHEEAPAPPMPEAAVKSTAVPVIEPVEPDNLKKIEGIGPKIEGILHEAGISTFAALAVETVQNLEKIVREDAGIRVAFPDTWPEQAQLAAAGEWEKLEALQDALKGGRRT